MCTDNGYMCEKCMYVWMKCICTDKCVHGYCVYRLCVYVWIVCICVDNVYMYQK
jgi:hypothetical protein